MTEKLNQCGEKIKLLDHTSELLKAKETEVGVLREKLVSLESSASSSKARPAGGKTGSKPRSSSEAKRILQLEKHVRELEKVIQKRFPNSLSALILAANSSTELELEAG